MSDNTVISGEYQDPFAPSGSRIESGATAYYEFSMEGFGGVLFDLTRTDDGTNGTLVGVVSQFNAATGGWDTLLDGAGAQVEFNGLAAGENVRRQLQIHPLAGPCPSDDADGVFKVGSSGIASNYYRQPCPETIRLELTAATDYSVFSATAYFLK